MSIRYDDVDNETRGLILASNAMETIQLFITKHPQYALQFADSFKSAREGILAGIARREAEAEASKMNVVS